MIRSIFSLMTTMLIASSILRANPVNDTVTMGASYANDVFYNMQTGVVKTEPRNNWDIAFYTTRWSAGIMINEGAGAELYTYPNGDTSAWNSVDISDMGNWKKMYNADTVWEEGAFNRNSLGHPDYGWGVYNMITHDVVGDSLFVMKLTDGSLRKIWIQRKRSIQNTWYFKFANIDGTGLTSVTLDATPYQANRLFIYYSMVNNAMIDREPDIDSWDLQWSRYIATVYDNTGVPSPYMVVGVTSNIGVGVSKHHPVPSSYENWTSKPFIEQRTPIGHDWKSFDMNLFQWQIMDSLVYFVKSRSGNIHKLTFNYFSGTGTGKTGLTRKVLSLVGQNEIAGENAFSIFPNPASGKLTINPGRSEASVLRIFDASGKQLISVNLKGVTQTTLDLNGWKNGLYIVELSGQHGASRQKLIVNQ
ncbi:MAG TPA: T9SS type A sorting domain-containing protein [Bacteroidales bacterium]|nr:T9SS type A sorting domain-containing protein [Bacteroidales bacterium]